VVDILVFYPKFNVMKYFGIVFLASIAALGADFLTGQAARITIGQSTFTAQDVTTPSAYKVGAVGGVAYANDMLFVADSNHIQAEPVLNRVLIYKNISRFILPPTSAIPQGVRCRVCVGTPDVGGADLVLGQSTFDATGNSISQTGLRTPSSVASDGKILVVSDTDNNRVLIWKTIPNSNGAPADVVLGQSDFKSFGLPSGATATSLRGPQGVWIQGTRLFVADTHNHRVVGWNNIPTSNNQPADFVLGEPNLTTAPATTVADLPPQANNLFAPVSVTSDGQRLFVTDLGHNRVLIWNSIPTQNQQPADVVIGQPDMTSEVDNNSTKLCQSTGTDSNNNPTYPQRCAATLSFPRFALSDGRRLFVADGGNDRVLVFNSIPTQNGQKADVVLGQRDELTNQVSDSTDTFRPDANILNSSPGTIRTPLALAWDGVNLYVADPYDRRVLVFTVGEPNVPINGISNSASRGVFALGSVSFSGTITANDTVTIKIQDTEYKYTIVKDDTITTVIQKLADLINGKSGSTPDPNVTAIPNPGFSQLVLTAKVPGTDGNNIAYSVTTSDKATILAATGGGFLSGAQDAAEVAPGTLVTIQGAKLSDTTAKGEPDSQGQYPTTLAGVEVYFDGIKAPLLFVSPTQINTQIPFEVSDSSGVSGFVRTVHDDGSVTSSTAIAIPIVLENPGIFAEEGTDPRPAIAYHATSNAIAIISVDGTVKANDTATITVEDRTYTYTIQAADTLAGVRDALINLINANADEKVIASGSGQFTRLVLTAKVPGPDGNAIPITASNSVNASIILTALNSQTCCANVEGSRITPDNPAVPGEMITVFATGIGVTLGPDGNPAGVTGKSYNGPAYNVPNSPVDNAQVGGRTATVINAGLKPGLLGVYEIKMQLNSDLPTNPNTQMFIAQSVFTSNIVTIPIVAPSK
jgi:uncharacterized protein (TIGR03437 family)